MRIVQFVNNLDMGGLERLVVDLAQCQLAEGHEPIIYCLTHAGKLAPEAIKMGIPIHAFGKPRGPRPGTAWKVAQQLRRDKPDVMHTHNHLVHHYGVLAGKLTGVPVIVNTRHRAEQRMFNGPSGLEISNESPDKGSDRIFRATLPWVGRVVLISESTRQFFVRHRGVPLNKTSVILNGARLKKFFDVPAHPQPVDPAQPSSRVRFGMAARLTAAKDHKNLLRAFAMVAAELPGAELQIAGDGELRAPLEAYTLELNLSRRVTFLGALSDTPAFLSQLDIFVLSSISEGLPLVILEAMAAGLPIVATRAGGVEEAAIEGRNAYLAPVADSPALALAMIRMARDPSMAQMGAAGRTMALEQFSIEQTWQEYLKLFRSLRANG